MTARFVLGLLLLAMAAGQALTFGSFLAALHQYGVIPEARVRTVATVLVYSEAIAGLALASGIAWARWPGAVLAIDVALAWTVLAVLALRARRPVPNCGCFGAYLPQRLRPSVLAQDAALAGLAVWVLARG